MTIKCGHCHDYHAAIADVRACSELTYAERELIAYEMWCELQAEFAHERF